jgi:hypothetical protein
MLNFNLRIGLVQLSDQNKAEFPWLALHLFSHGAKLRIEFENILPPKGSNLTS